MISVCFKYNFLSDINKSIVLYRRLNCLKYNIWHMLASWRLLINLCPLLISDFKYSITLPIYLLIFIVSASEVRKPFLWLYKYGTLTINPFSTPTYIHVDPHLGYLLCFVMFSGNNSVKSCMASVNLCAFNW